MTAPLTDDEAQRVTVCDCGHPWAVHFGPGGGCFAWTPPTAGSPAEGSGLCPCDRDDQTLAQVAALLTKREAAVLHALADKWQFGAWADVLTKAGARTIAKAEAVTKWLHAQAYERGPR